MTERLVFGVPIELLPLGCTCELLPSRPRPEGMDPRVRDSIMLRQDEACPAHGHLTFPSGYPQDNCNITVS